MLKLPEFPRLIHKFLAKQLHPDSPGIPLIQNDGKIHVFYSATATFRAPSNPSGIRSMWREQICTAPSWRNGASHYDCAFINNSSEDDPLHGLDVCRIFLSLLLSTRVPYTHALSSSGTLLSAMNVMRILECGWSGPTFSVMVPVSL